jgi:hypothetical protein
VEPRALAARHFITRLSAVLHAEPGVVQVGINYADAAELTGACAPEAAVRTATLDEVLCIPTL